MHSLPLSTGHMLYSSWAPCILALLAFDFAYLDLHKEPVRECDNYCTSSVPRFEYSVTNLRDGDDKVGRG